MKKGTTKELTGAAQEVRNIIRALLNEFPPDESNKQVWWNFFACVGDDAKLLEGILTQKEIEIDAANKLSQDVPDLNT